MLRQVTVYESAENGKMTVFDNVEVKTLSDLKVLLDEKGINYDNMNFFEGVTGTQILHDDSIIPDSIPYKGDIIHDVFINLMVKDSKVSSGLYSEEELLSYSRNGLYELIKPYTEEASHFFGRPYTQVSNQELRNFLLNLTVGSTEPENTPKDNTFDNPLFKVLDTVVDVLGKEAVYDYLDYLYEEKKEEGTAETMPKSRFSAEEINSFIYRD